MPATARQPTRTYLPAEQRRDHLLTAAARLVRRGGWGALSMQGLAVAAGVSRQLVYEHFESADDLTLATLTHLFERSLATTTALVRRDASLADTVRAGLVQFLELPPEERRALRALAAEADPGRRNLARARTRLRKRVAGAWVPMLRARADLTEPEAIALAWMLNTAAWGLSDLIADGSIDREQALDLFVRVAEAAITAHTKKGSTP